MEELEVVEKKELFEAIRQGLVMNDCATDLDTVGEDQDNKQMFFNVVPCKLRSRDESYCCYLAFDLDYNTAWRVAVFYYKRMLTDSKHYSMHSRYAHELEKRLSECPELMKFECKEETWRSDVGRWVEALCSEAHECYESVKEKNGGGQERGQQGA